MSAPKFDVKTFHKRLENLYKEWKENKSNSKWGDADALAIIYGKSDEEQVYRKSSIIQLWLLAYELPDTLIVACEKTLYIYTSSRKIKLLQPLKDDAPEGSIPIEFVTRTKNEEEIKNALKGILDNIHQSFEGKSIGILQRDKQEGSSVDQWKSLIADETTVDVTKGFASLLASKDDIEQKYIRRASNISSRALSKLLIVRIEKIIDEEQKVKHSDIAEEIQKLILSGKLSKESIDRCYTPIIQSGGEYDLKPNACSSDEILTFDTIICSLGIRYRNYCSNIARTLFINPTSEQEKNIEFLLDLQNVCVAALKPGETLSNVYKTAVAYIADKRPDLSDKFVKNLGFGIGLEYRESSLVISAKNKNEIKEGMTFNLILGFDNLPSVSKDYAMLLSDIVLIKEEEAELLTVLPDKKFTYNLQDEEESKPSIDAALIEKLAASNSKQARASTVDTKAEEEEKRRQHQKEIAQKQLQERIRKYSNDVTGEENETSPVIQTDLVAYKSATEYPTSAPLHRIHVDSSREAIILPIYGNMVPFHISTIKSVTKDNEYLRINFLYPSTKTQLDQLNHQALKDASSHSFIRELSYCIPDQSALTSYMHQVKQLLKAVKQREMLNDKLRSIKKQENLRLSKGAVPRLPQVFPRPSVGGKTSGVLEAHRNGLRFHATRKSKTPIDILYKNVRHAFFQPCDAKEMIVALHFHLYDDIMVGRKKTKDVQFCVEATELSQSLSKYNRYGDPDEFEEERRERALRKKYNSAFQRFAKQVEAQVNNMFEFDIPYKKLGFYGVPFKSFVFVQPTVSCLVQLIEPPFFVLSLPDIEICSLERVSFQLQQFDAIFILKDFSKPVIRIDNIPMDSLETLKKWLDSCDISYYENSENLLWKKIMKIIRDDPIGFFNQGGWADMLRGASDAEEEVVDPDDDDFDADDFAPPDEDDDSLELYSEEEEEEEEEDDDDVSGESEQGDDWDDLEKKCLQEDMRKKKKRKERGEDFSDDDEPVRKKVKRR